MFKRNRVIAATAVIGALVATGPIASAGAATTSAASTSTPGSSIPCYPFPAFCDPSTGQPASWAPWWVRPALGLPAAPLFQPITIQFPTTLVPLTHTSH